MLARCSNENVADLIDFTVMSGNKSKTWIIDAANDRFTKDDYQAIGKEVTDFIK